MERKVHVQELYRGLVACLTDKPFLKTIKATKKAMQTVLKEEHWEEKTGEFLSNGKISCQEMLTLCEPILQRFSIAPKIGWLDYTYRVIGTTLFPENPTMQKNPLCEPGRLIYLKILHFFLMKERKTIAFDREVHFAFLSEEIVESSAVAEEYQQLIQIFRENYFYEFMRIGAEITPYRTLGHIAGVHHVALHVATQLKAVGVPIDLALISGAALGHDLGKYGCKPKEAKRIPYLHYFYTERFFRMGNMPTIGHIAANHSTWDLELENLSVESLVLIYADFRVKSSRDAQGKEIVHFYELKDSFDVILSKLDNVDEAKKNRYIRVYGKLEDFEHYMKSLGVHTELECNQVEQVVRKNPALLHGEEVIQALKYLAIESNISLMHRISSEEAFVNILEAARSEKDWKSIRAYLNIFEEYFTYMTKKQKLMTLNFLYELLMHREGDIRRQAADIMGKIIVHYEEDYRKEIPEGFTIEAEAISHLDIWGYYLDAIISPDHKVTDQHKRWIGYTLKLVVDSVLMRCREKERSAYLMEVLLRYDHQQIIDDATAFILLDSILAFPLHFCQAEALDWLLRFTRRQWERQRLEVQIAVLRVVQYFLEKVSVSEQSTEWQQFAEELAEFSWENEPLSAAYLRKRICLHLHGSLGSQEDTCGQETAHLTDVSEIFLENLKAATPWVVKAVNIELLLDQLQEGKNAQILHVAAHLSNLIKVSERVAVRHQAGSGLLAIGPRLSLDQVNEVVIELTKGLEIGEYEFSKYIPEYLGALALYLHPNELDEFISNLQKLTENKNDRVCSVALHTLGILIQHYPRYKGRFAEVQEAYEERRQLMLGMVLKGLGNYRETVRQESFLVIGRHIFGTDLLSLHDKVEIFRFIHKKMLTLFAEQPAKALSFFHNAASLNHIYRFISDYHFHFRTFDLPEPKKVAFFPGTFDPFSLSHKGIADAIRQLGFEVYLALDEFSWSKKTQPRMMRRNIISVSVAGDVGVYLFPDDLPINIANGQDLKGLKEIFAGQELYIVVGSDVVSGASSYQAPPKEHSIHQLNHVVFKRATAEEGTVNQELDYISPYDRILGKVVELSLPVYLEDISSTRIRENIDYNRDISNLIDPLAQSYIYDNSLYLRESQYKQMVPEKSITFTYIETFSAELTEELMQTLFVHRGERSRLSAYFLQEGTKGVVIRDGECESQAVATAAFHATAKAELYETFGTPDIASQIRQAASGKIATLSCLWMTSISSRENLDQLALTELLAHCLKEDYTYAIYHDKFSLLDEQKKSLLERQGFVLIGLDGNGHPIYGVDMCAPVTLFQDISTMIKAPFNHRGKIEQAIVQAHQKMQHALTRLYPGTLILSVDSSVMHHRIAELVVKENQVPIKSLEKRRLGKCLCVPYGKILRGMVVPNTVTKSLHTEKVFSKELDEFQIREFPFYSPLETQMRTLKSFERPLLLVDDLLHKGYRMRKLDPLLKTQEIDVHHIIVGILSGRGKDLMTIQGRQVNCVYFIPHLRAWFDESGMYPFIGGDSVDREEEVKAGLVPSVNLILPYAAPRFLQEANKEALYHYSMTCLENARDILRAVEAEYQLVVERNLTLNRLSEAFVSPRCPDQGLFMQYDQNLAPSVYLENDIEKLIRLKGIVE